MSVLPRFKVGLPYNKFVNILFVVILFNTVSDDITVLPTYKFPADILFVDIELNEET